MQNTKCPSRLRWAFVSSNNQRKPAYSLQLNAYSLQLLVSLVFIARLFNQDAVVFITVFRVIAVDRRIFLVGL